MAGYKFFCFGNPELELDDCPVKLEMRKSLALLIYLRMSGHDCPRETLAALFWPEYDQLHGLANLRRTLASLNKSLRIDIVEADREKIGLKEPSRIWLDVEAFQTYLASGDTHPHPQHETCPECQGALESALQIYQGDFLEGFNLKDCPDFDEWQLLQRESLRQEFGLALQKLSEAYASQSRWKAAIIQAQRWVGLDRLNETAQRVLISLYAQSGQRKAALHEYEELALLLNEQLGQQPEQETRQLYEQIKGREEARKRIEPSKQTVLFPLLKAKMFLPAPPANRVRRSDLMHRLSDAERKALTIISAPAGYGKTTLLAEWIERTSLPVAWLALDNGDNEPFRFLTYLIAALQSVHEDVGQEALQMLESSQTVTSYIILASLINDLMKVSEPYILALDDYHFITEPAVHEVVSYLLDHLPVNLHMVIATRADPPLPSGRLRAADQLLEFRTQDLRFSTEEVKEFLNTAMRFSLSGENVQALEMRTEGWVVGLKMAALAMQGLFRQGHREASEFIQAFSGSQRYVLEYLMEEVMKLQLPHIQTFLVETSILDRLSGPLCDTLMSEEWKCSGESGQAVLEYLDKSNLFLISQDENQQWYRYHHLFADLLRLRLTSFSTERVKALHLQASRWYEAEGYAWDAIDHAIAGQDYQRASDLIEQKAHSTIPLSTNYYTLRQWINRLPENLLINHPWICVTQAYSSLSRGRLNEVDGWLQQVENIVSKMHGEEKPHLVDEIQNHITNLRTYRAFMTGNLDIAISQGKLLLEKQHTLETKLRGQIFLEMGEIYITAGEFEQAVPLLRAAWEIGTQIPDLIWFTRSAFRFGIVLKAQGRLTEAEKVYRENLKLLQEAGFTDSSLSGRSEIGLGDIIREKGDLTTAEGFLTRGFRHLQLQAPSFDLALALMYLSRLEREKGNVQRALEFIEQANQSLRVLTIHKNLRSIWEYYCVPLWIETGDWRRIEQWMEERHFDADTPLSYWNEQPLISLSRFYIAQGNLSDAIHLLARLAQKTEIGGRYSRLIEIWNLSALLLSQLGNIEESLHYLCKSLILAEPEGYRRIFLDEGQKMIELLTRLQETSFAPEQKSYVTKLLHS